jgi:hypothetical protein
MSYYSLKTVNAVTILQLSNSSLNFNPRKPDSLEGRHYRIVTLGDPLSFSDDLTSPSKERPVLIPLELTVNGFMCPIREVTKVLEEFVKRQHESVSDVKVLSTAAESELWRKFRKQFPNYNADFLVTLKQNGKEFCSFFMLVDLNDCTTELDWFVVKSEAKA